LLYKTREAFKINKGLERIVCEQVIAPVLLESRGGRKMKRWEQIRVCGYLLSFLALSFSLNLYAFELSAAQFEQVQGQVFVINESGKSRVGLKGGEVLSDEVVETKAGSRAVLVFDDGSRVLLGPNTRLKVNDPMTDGGSSVMLFLGRIFSKVVPRISEEPVFTVQTLTSTAGVRGTDFEVATGMDGSDIIGVDDGEVIVSTDSEESPVKKGEEAEVSNDGIVKKVKRKPRTDEEWEQWFKQREQFFIEHSELVLNNLSRKIETSRARIKEQDDKLTELKKQLTEQAEGKRVFYFRVRNQLKQQIHIYSRMLSNLGQVNNRLAAVDNIISQAEEQIRLHPEAYSREFQDKIKSARAKLDAMNVKELYKENRKMIKNHFAMLARLAKRFNLEKELFRSLPAKTKKQILNKLRDEQKSFQEKI